MKKMLLLLPLLLIVASCQQGKKEVVFKAPAVVVQKISPEGGTIQAEEHKPFTVKVKILNPSPSLESYWIWKNEIAGYGTSVTITPDEEDGGKTIPLTFVATGKGYETQEITYQVVIKEVDDPPEITQYSPESTTITLKKGETIQFYISGKDPDSEIKYIWYVNGNEAGYSNTLTFTATGEMEGQTITITGTVSGGNKSASVTWHINVEHYDFPPEINIPFNKLILSLRFFKKSFPEVIDLSRYIVDKDNDFYSLQITFETSDSGIVAYQNGKYMALRINWVHYPTESIRIKVSDGEKENSATLYLIYDSYLIFKNEYQYSLSLVGYNQFYVLSPVPGSQSPYVISTIAPGDSILQNGEKTTYIYGFTTWGAYHLLKYNPLSLQLVDEEDISFCASSPYESEEIYYNSEDAIVFTNFEKFHQPVTGERFSIYYPLEDTCHSYPIYTTGIDQDMSYEGITEAWTSSGLTLFLAASGFQGFDYQNYRSIFGDSYLTMVTISSLDPTNTLYTTYNFHVTGCVNLQDVKAFEDDYGHYLAGVCTGDYSSTPTTDTGYLILFSIDNGYPQEVTRISLGTGSHPGGIEVVETEEGIFLLVGSSSGKLFVVRADNEQLNSVAVYSFSDYGYGGWAMVTPVIGDYKVGEAGAVVSSWGMNSTLFLKSDIENPDTPWEHLFDLGNAGASSWITTLDLGR